MEKEKKIVNVYCQNCHKTIGTRKGNRYDVKEGTIQQGQGENEPLLSFCSEECLNSNN